MRTYKILLLATLITGSLACKDDPPPPPPPQPVPQTEKDGTTIGVDEEGVKVESENVDVTIGKDTGGVRVKDPK